MDRVERLWSKVEEVDGHRLWTGGLSGGYPVMGWDDQSRTVARIVWELSNPKLGPRDFVRVTCGESLCVKLEHLGVFPGSIPKGQEVLEARALERFWRQVEKMPDGGCWLWRGYKLNTGYGMIHIGSRYIPAHRYSYEINTGPLEPGKVICHACDNPICVRPEHLFQGTPRDNVMDMHAKGRGVKHKPRSWQSLIPDLAPRGETHHRSKLTDAQAEEIRAIFASGEMNQIELGKEFGVSNSTISLLVSGRRYGAKPEAPKVSEGPETRLQFMALGC